MATIAPIDLDLLDAPEIAPFYSIMAISAGTIPRPEGRPGRAAV
jgi:hypothetical protein